MNEQVKIYTKQQISVTNSILPCVKMEELVLLEKKVPTMNVCVVRVGTEKIAKSKVCTV